MLNVIVVPVCVVPVGNGTAEIGLFGAPTTLLIFGVMVNDVQLVTTLDPHAPGFVLL